MTGGVRAQMVFIALLAAVACARNGPSFPSDALDRTIAASIGDPDTCVVIADRTTGKTVYTYGESFNCARRLPACDRPGQLTANAALALAKGAEPRTASCPSNASASRMVGWSAGRVSSPNRDLIYSAVMEGERALPGQEMSARLTQAFGDAGL